MSDSTRTEDPSSPQQQAVPDGPSTVALAASVRRLRVWLIALTSVVVIVVIGALTVVSLMALSLGSISSEATGTSDEQVASIKREISNALGDRLQSVEVRAVRVEYGEEPFPYSLLSGGGEESPYVEYRLKGSSVLVADLLGGPYGNDASASGMIPTQGSLASRMTQEQFDRLLAAYAVETESPLGAVRRYGDKSDLMDSGAGSVPDEVTVGNKTFKTAEMWSATQGRVVKGDTINLADESSFMRKALVFREDPTTGEFTFLGTESAESMW